MHHFSAQWEGIGFFTILVSSAAMAKQDDYIRYTIRVPKEVYGQIETAAHDSNRSVNAEIIARLEYTIRADLEFHESLIDHLKSKEGIPPPSFEPDIQGHDDHLRRPPSNENIDGYMKSIFEQLRELNMKVSAVSIHENGEKEFTVTQDNRFSNHPVDTEPFPPPTEDDLLHVIEARAAAYGYKLVKNE